MVSPNSVKILEICKVAPANNLPDSVKESSLPLTFFDSTWLKFPPTQSLFFYKLTETESTSANFHSKILPIMKESLSQTLLHFLPVTGHVTWPSESPRPIINYSSENTVSLTVAESNGDFDHFISNEIHEVADSFLYVPKLLISETMATTIALQITFFPGKGFSVGVTTHHAVFDGNSAFMFIKAWSSACKQYNENPSKPFSFSPELIPSFDRSVIKDPAEFESMYLNHWISLTNQLDSNSNPRSLNLLPFFLGLLPNNLVRSSFQLSREKIEKIRENVLLNRKNQPEKHDRRLSTFVLTYAYALVCLVKAREKGGVKAKRVNCGFAVDCRSRLELNPQIPINYFGNAISLQDMVAETEAFMKENGVAAIAEKLSECINGLENGVFHGTEERLERLSVVTPEELKLVIAGSTRLAFYRVDFGWGSPVKMAILAMNVGGISVMEGKDGNGDVEIGVVLPRQEMEDFASFFAQGLH